MYVCCVQVCVLWCGVQVCVWYICMCMCVLCECVWAYHVYVCGRMYVCCALMLKQSFQSAARMSLYTIPLLFLQGKSGKTI